MKKQEATRIIRETFESPFDKERFRYFVRNLFNHLDESNNFVYAGNRLLGAGAYQQYFDSIERIGKYEDKDGKRIDALIVRLKKETSLERARTRQRNFIAWYLNRGFGGKFRDAAVVAFVSPAEEDWRFSLVKMETILDEYGVRDKLSPARRYSFLVGSNEGSHTAQSRLLPVLAKETEDPTLEELEEAFNIETVTQEFFNRYRDLFLKVKESLDEILRKDCTLQDDFTRQGMNTVDFSKKLLGQIVFLYFLQRKGWLGVPAGKNWGEGDRNFLRSLFNRCQQEGRNYFNDYLEYLFYDALNNENRGGPDPSYYRRFGCRIPFLNGGLFESDYSWKETNIVIPNDLFSNQEVTSDGDIGTGILDVFDRFNFTVKEDEPLEKEVAVDPEMLGKVFENLLEVKDRKSRGTYYTPREIVHYMCQESLINYLNTAVNTIVPREDIETFVRMGEFAVEHDTRVENKGKETRDYSYKLPESIRRNARIIDDKLANIRICDPAVGSGAFPVGLMMEIVRARNTLTTYLPDKEVRSNYDFKRHAIRNCLYGVDIDPGAVEIARLRLWLSLVVDEESIEQIQPLPNLDYKIVQGNSLLGYPYTPQGLAKIEQLKGELFEETRPEEKEQLRNEIDGAIKNLLEGSEKALGYKVDFDFKIFFSEVFREKGGFDVVIANPPYVRQEKIKDLKPALQKYEVYNSTSDLYIYFYERSYNLLKNGGILTFISSNKWMRARYGEKLRQFFKEKSTIRQLIDFNGHKVFETTVDTNIIILQKEIPPADYRVPFVNIKSDFTGGDLQGYLSAHQQSIANANLSQGGWSLFDEQTLAIKNKAERVGIPLKEWDVQIYRGIVTGFNEAFIIDTPTKERLCREDPKSAEILKPILRGRDIGRYYYKWAGLWLIATFPAREIDIDRYSAVKDYLKTFGKRMSQTGDPGCRKRTDHKWFETQDNIAYYKEFEKEKIVYPCIMNEDPCFAFDSLKHYLPCACKYYYWKRFEIHFSNFKF